MALLYAAILCAGVLAVVCLMLAVELDARLPRFLRPITDRGFLAILTATALSTGVLVVMLAALDAVVIPD